MKGGYNGLKGKEISLITIFLMSATIIVWAWLKTPLILTVPPQAELELSPDIGRSTSVESMKPTEGQINIDKGELSFTEKETVNGKEEPALDVVAQLVSVRRSEESMTKSNLETISSQEKGLSDKVAKQKEFLDAGENEDGKSSSSSMEVEEKKQPMEEEKKVKQEEHIKDMIPRTASPEERLSVGGKDSKNPTSDENKVCNYAKGKWVIDDKRPLYSGFGCKKWLSGMWACRLTQRTDFAYEKLRWQPKDCQMEEFEGSKFLKRLQNKILAFVGDSLGRQQFQSLMCTVTGGKETHDVADVGNEYGLALAPGATRPSGWAYRFSSTNTTILYYWSSTLCDTVPIDINNPASDYAMHLDRPPAFLRDNLHRFDVLVLNTAHHWNRGKLKANRWVMYVGGVPNTDRKIAMIGNAKNLTIYSIVSWVNSQLPKYPGLKAFYRTISPRHFVGGEWNTGGSCDNTTPMSVGKEVLEDESSDRVAAGAVKGTGIKLLDITALSQIRDEGHISRFSITAKPGVQDCLHWCLPGVPDTWNEILFTQI